MRNTLPFTGGRNRIRLTALGNGEYSLTYPRDVTTTKDSAELKYSDAAVLESCNDLIVRESPSGSLTMCTRDAVENAAIEEFPWIANPVIGAPTSDRIVFNDPSPKSNE